MATKRTRYSKVPTSDHNNDELRPGSGSSASPASQRKELVESISNKLHAAIWVGGSIFVLYYTDFFRLAWADERVNRCARTRWCVLARERCSRGWPWQDCVGHFADL